MSRLDRLYPYGIDYCHPRERGNRGGAGAGAAGGGAAGAAPPGAGRPPPAPARARAARASASYTWYTDYTLVVAHVRVKGERGIRMLLVTYGSLI